MKTIRFKGDYIYSRAGDVMDEEDGVAEILIQRGLAEEVQDGPESEDASEEAAQTPPLARRPVTTRRVPGPRE